jgi:hypothetical protein
MIDLLAFTVAEAAACAVEIAAVHPGPLTAMMTTDILKIAVEDTTTEAWQALYQRLALVRMGGTRLTTVVRNVRTDGVIFEVRIYMDGWVELYSDYGCPSDPTCFKCYYHGELPPV